MRRETGRPDTSDLEQMISFQIGARSDADEQFGRSPPRSVFDIERDAEVQDIQRNLERLKTATDEFLATFQKKAKRRTYGLMASLLASFGVIGWLTLTFHAHDRIEAVSSSGATVRPVASVSAPTVPKVSVAPIMAKTASVPVQVASSAGTPPAVALAAASQSASPQILPKDKTVLALPSGRTASAKAGAATSVRSSSRHSESATKTILAGPAESKPVAPVKSAKPALAADNKVFALESTPPLASTEPAVEHPTAVAQSPRKATAADTKRAAPAARREKYGSSGVITMTPGGVVIFDQARHAQRMVLVGEPLPDGSTLKGVDVKANRISTENGDVIFD